MRPRVVFFDYWTKGAEKFARLVNPEDRGEIDYLLFHLGSFRDPSVPRTEFVHGLPAVDIASFAGMSLDEILTSLRPSVLVGLNIATMFDRALYMTAERLGIPTVFLQHGSWPDSDRFEEIAASLDTGFTLADRFRRIPAFSRIFPWYLRARGSLLDTTPWKVVLRLALKPTTSHFFPLAARELWPSLALLYCQASLEHLAQTHHMPRERLRVVGNPELDHAATRRMSPFGPERRAELVRRAGLNPARPIVCYIEDGFVEQQNYLGWTEEVRVELFRELHAACSSSSVQLLVRPHPVTNTAALERELGGAGDVVLTRGLSLVDTCDVADVVMGTTSTALETAVVLGRPLLTAAWHYAGRSDLSPYVRFEVAHELTIRADLPSAIARATRGELPARDADLFCQRRLGPIDGRSTERIRQHLRAQFDPSTRPAAT